MDGEGAHAVEGRGLAIDGAGGRPGGAPGELVLADLIRGQGGGPRGAAEEGGEMGDPAAGGAPGPELPDLVVLEVGVAELSEGRPRRAPTGAGLHLIVDSTGLSIVGEGEWAAAKHGGRGRRGWKTRHLGVDRSGVIVARALTEASVDDATTGITLIEAVDGALGQVTADAAYDTIGFCEAAGARGATVVVPPTSTAHVSRHGPRSSARDRTILAVKEIGRRRWTKTSGYHGQARVENAFFRYKSIIGDSLRACSPAGRGTEVDLACTILNQMTVLGRPMSYRIGR